MWQFTPQNSRKGKCLRWVNTPIIRRGSDDMYRLRRDYVVVYFYPSPLRLQVKMYPCGECRDCHSLQELRDVLDEIRQFNKSDAKIVCFVQSLDILVKANALGNVKWIGMTRKDNDNEFHFCAIDDCFEFRNLNPIIEEDVFCCDDIFNILCSFNIPLYKVCWSLGYITKKILYTPEISNILWEDTKYNNRFFRDFDVYKDMFAGSSSGFLWLDRNIKGKIIDEPVHSFDIKSAYAWVLATDTHFPQTMPKRTRNIRDLIDAIENDRYFLIIIRGHDLGNQFNSFQTKLPENIINELERIEEYLSGKTDKLKKYNQKEYYDNIYQAQARKDQIIKDYFEYAFNCYDYKSIHLFKGVNFSEIISKYNCIIYVCKKCGRLKKEFRDRIVELYNLKESIEDKNNPERKQYKKQLEITYGKGIQDYNFKTIEEVKAHYNHQGKNYLLPHWSKLCISAIKFRILRAYMDDGGVIYCDTDGIKSRNEIDYTYNLFINVYNKEVKKVNRNAGYPDLDLGMWKYEWTSDRFIAVAKKQYCAQFEDGTIDATLSAVPKKDIPQYIEQNDDFMQALADGLTVKKFKLKYIKSKDEIVYEPYDIVLGKGE